MLMPINQQGELNKLVFVSSDNLDKLFFFMDIGVSFAFIFFIYIILPSAGEIISLSSAVTFLFGVLQNLIIVKLNVRPGIKTKARIYDENITFKIKYEIRNDEKATKTLSMKIYFKFIRVFFLRYK